MHNFTDMSFMKGLDLQLKFDYLKQSSELVKEFESATLSFLETNEKEYLDTAYKKAYILHRTARAVAFDNLVEFFDQLEVLFSFLRNQIKNEIHNSEFLLDLTDYINNLHTVLQSDISAKFNHHEIFNRIKSFIALNNQKHFQTPEHAHHEKLNIAHEELYDLSLELYSLKSSLSTEKPSISFIQSLNYLSEKLLNKSQELNLVKIKSVMDALKSQLHLYTHNKMSIHAFGEDLLIEKKHAKNLERPLLDIFVHILRHKKEQEPMQLIYKVEQNESNTLVDMNFAKTSLFASEKENLENLLKDNGLRFEMEQNQHSGLSLKIFLSKSYDLIHAYVFEINESKYILDREFIYDTVEFSHDSVFYLENHGHYYLSNGQNVPIIENDHITMGTNNFDKGIIIQSSGKLAVLPISKFGRYQKVVKKYSYSVNFDKEMYRSLAFLDNGKPAFVFHAENLIKNAHAQELKLTKYIELNIGESTLAFRAEHVKEVVSKELLSVSESNDGVYGLINYHGDVIPVFHPHYLNLDCNSFTNIIIFNCEGSHKAMLVGGQLNVKSILNEEIYSEHAFESKFKPQWIIESYQKEGKEVNVLNPENIFTNQLFLKKVA